jgi:hypothetical protein
LRSDNRLLIPLCLFGGVFLYALGASLFIREILLPELLPHLHAGGGFFAGGDFVGHFERAIEAS